MVILLNANFSPRLIPEPLPDLEEILVYLTDSTEYSLPAERAPLSPF